MLPDGVLTPGLIDLQINGAFGVDFADAPPGDWRMIRSALLRTAVTAFAPDAHHGRARPPGRLPLDIDVAAREVLHGARILGAHVEGPFLAPVTRGAPRRLADGDPTPEPSTCCCQGAAVRGCSPWRPSGGSPRGDRAADGGRVSGVASGTPRRRRPGACRRGRRGAHGHPCVQRAAALGHREPGTAGAALTDPRLTVGMIADLRHIAGQIVALIFRAAAGGVVLVTDAVAARACTSDRYRPRRHRRLPRRRGPAAPRRRDDRRFRAQLDQAVRNAVSCGVDPAQVLQAVTRTPADLVGPRRPRPAGARRLRRTSSGGATTGRSATCGSAASGRWTSLPGPRDLRAARAERRGPGRAPPPSPGRAAAAGRCPRPATGPRRPRAACSRAHPGRAGPAPRAPRGRRRARAAGPAPAPSPAPGAGRGHREHRDVAARPSRAGRAAGRRRRTRAPRRSWSPSSFSAASRAVG